MAKSLGPDDYEILPPQSYDEGQVRRDLLRLTIRGLSIEPYLQRTKTPSVWYSTRERKKVDAMAEYIRAKTEVIRTAHTYMLEAAMVQPDYINREINAKSEDQIIAKMERELKFKELNKKLMLIEDEGKRELEKTELKHEIEMATLRKERAMLYQTPMQSESETLPREKTPQEKVSEDEAQLSQEHAAQTLGKVKHLDRLREVFEQYKLKVAEEMAAGKITPEQAKQRVEDAQRIFEAQLGKVI